MEYRDDTPITQDDIDKLYAAISVGDLEQGAQKLAKWVEEKMMGEQTRKSLALWAILQARITEYLINNTDNFEGLMNNLKSELLGRQGDVEKRQTDVENQFNAVIANATKDSEVILARDSQIYGTFPTLDGRFERLESIVSQYVPMGFTVTLKHNQNRKPEVAVSYVEYAFGTEPNGFGTGPAGSFGGYHNRSVQCMVDYPDMDTCIIHLPRSEALNGKPVFEVDAWRLIDGYKTLTFDLGENIDTEKALAGNGDNKASLDVWSGSIEGANLARGTTDKWTKATNFNGGVDQSIQVANVYLDQVKAGDTLTISVKYQYSGVTASNASLSLKGWGDVTAWGETGQMPRLDKITLSTGGNTYSGNLTYSFKVTEDMAKNHYWWVAWYTDNVNAGTTFEWSSFKAEIGNTATPWVPATENELGGVNLIKNTSNKLVSATTQNGLVIVSSPNSDNSISLSKYQGKTVTLRAWIEKPASPTKIQIWTNKGGLYANAIATGESGYSTVTGVVPTDFTDWNIVIGGRIANNSLSYKEVKLELGAVPTPWSPAPEDLEVNDK